MNETSRALNWFTPMRFGILLALMILAAFPQVIFGLQTFVIRDYGFFAYPLAHFQKECFWNGQIPLWDPYNYCGAPFLAQWNTMPLYPPALIYLLLPLNWSLSFFCLLHLWFGGLGMYFLARRWTGNDFGAAFAGTVFAFNGVSLNLLMWPSHTATYAWMPWVVLTVELAWGGECGRSFSRPWPGRCKCWRAARRLFCSRGSFCLCPLDPAIGCRESYRVGDRSGYFPTVVAQWSSCLTAAQLLPFLDLASHSERHGTYADLRWSMPRWGWANYLVPMFYGDTWNMGGVFFQYGQLWTSSYYLGIGALWLAVLAMLQSREGRVRLLGIVAIVAFVFALGENTFVYPALRKFFPVLSLITYPVKYVLLITFIAPLLAAFALKRLNSEEGVKSRRGIVEIGVLLLALIGGIIFWAIRFTLFQAMIPVRRS